MEKMIYFFGRGVAEGASESKELLGGKGFNLAQMAGMGMPVPAGFTIPTSYSTKYMSINDELMRKAWLYSLSKPIMEAYSKLKDMNETDYCPLVSVRSGARVSMPGMMDTVLNVGLTTSNLGEWSSLIGERAAWDSFRRLMQMYGDVVFGIPKAEFEHIVAQEKAVWHVENDSDLDVHALKGIVHLYHELYQKHGRTFPDTVEDQIIHAVEAVFASWMNERAVVYREIHGIPEDWGTAVNIQSMVFGNMNNDSATGVVFTRCPSTGEKHPVGEFLVNAQGEDVVAGVRTPDPIANMEGWNPTVYTQLMVTLNKLEEFYADMQDVEFTVENGKLFILQTRNGKRSSKAAFRIAHAFWKEGVLSIADALGRVKVSDYVTGLQCKVSPEWEDKNEFVGIAGGGGVVTGVVARDNEYAIAMKNLGKQAILVSHETTPDDIAGMAAAVGILTQTGGQTSHAAVVARGMNKTCVVGCTALPLDTMKNGDPVSIDGATGKVWMAKVDVLEPEVDEYADALLCGYAAKNGIELPDNSNENTCYLDVEAPDLDKEISRINALLTDTTTLMVNLTLYWDFEVKSTCEYLSHSIGMDETEQCLRIESVQKMLSAFAEHNCKKIIVLPAWMDVKGLDELLHGFKFLNQIETLQDLFEGLVVVDGAVIKKLFGTKKMYNSAMKAFAAAGMVPTLAPHVLSKTDLVLQTMKG